MKIIIRLLKILLYFIIFYLNDALFVGCIMFFFTMFLMDGGSTEVKEEANGEVAKTASLTYDNSTFTNDDGQSPLELPRFPERPPIYEHSRL